MPMLRLVAETTYFADPEDYGTDDPEKCALLDESNALETLEVLAAECDIRVEPVA